MTTLFYTLPPERIFENNVQSSEPKNVQIKGRGFVVYPHVYPSGKVRTTNFLLEKDNQV